ncbi:MAG TPA: hypothetical protein VK730_14430 [Solirubrobacteraceae bacterium]|jgi:hypothetical protein|nr:hypothetical protein [Solirubrobacteraceae bacterium]
MGTIASRYTRWQREAVVVAYDTLDITAGRVVELAAAGALRHTSGALLAAFDIPENTVRSMGRRARRREVAEAQKAGLLEISPRDSVERLRQRFLLAIDQKLSRIEVEQAEGRSITGEELRQVARALRELAALPGRQDPRPPAPGAKMNGRREGGETRGGLAGRILAAHRTAAI